MFKISDQEGDQEGGEKNAKCDKKSKNAKSEKMTNFLAFWQGQNSPIVVKLLLNVDYDDFSDFFLFMVHVCKNTQDRSLKFFLQTT